MEQPTSDSQILSVTQFLQAIISCSPWSSYIGWSVTCMLPLGRETDSKGFEWLPLQWLVIWDLLYTPIELRPVLPNTCESDLFCLFFFSPLLFFISIECFSFLLQYWSYDLIRSSTALFTGCKLIMYNLMMYAHVHLALWTRYVICGHFHVLNFTH